jgi:hypothetical protein
VFSVEEAVATAPLRANATLPAFGVGVGVAAGVAVGFGVGAVGGTLIVIVAFLLRDAL